MASTAHSLYRDVEDQVLSVVRHNVKTGVLYAHEYPYAAYAVAGCTLMLFPQPRSFIFRNVFGALQSQVCNTISSPQ